MSYELLRSEEVAGQTIKLIRKGQQFRVVLDSPVAGLHLPALTVRWIFRTGEVARLAFEFAVATQRAWDAITRGEPAGDFLRAMQRASADVNTAARAHSDFPPGSAGAAELLGTDPEDD